MYSELTQAVLSLNRLQSENNEGASHNLEPAQERVLRALSGHVPERGLVRLAIDCSPEVRGLRNRLDAAANYGSRRSRALSMRGDVLELMDRRDAAARALGYPDYPSAILVSEGMPEDKLRERLEKYLDLQLPRTAGRVRADGISMGSWFDWLDRLGAFDRVLEPMPLLRGFAERTGMEPVLPLLEIRPSDGVCFASHIGERITMHVSPVGSADSLSTLFHEFGHACVYALTPAEELPRLSATVDEAAAVLFENAAIRLMSNGQLRAAALELRHMEYTRTCLSGLFELDLWHDRSDPEALYRRRFGLLDAGCDPALWALDSFRYIDCMTIFAYTLGQSLADGLTDSRLTTLLPELAESAAGMTLGELAEKLEVEGAPHEWDNRS